jgi:uncharacterized protein CbrC (UPF0167 family)
MELTKIAPYETSFQNYQLTCPIAEGHRMLPIKTICSIIDVDYQTQDTWLKKNEFFNQLYRLSYIVAADGKQREMNCMSFFDAYAWIASINIKNRSEESIKRQTLFLVWLREQMMSFYKSVDVFIQENKYEAELEQLKEELETKLIESNQNAKAIKDKLKEIDNTINDIRHNRFTGQTALPFPEN